MNLTDDFDMEYLRQGIFREKPDFDYQRGMEASDVMFSQKNYRDKLKALYTYMDKQFQYIDKFAESKNHGLDVKMYSCKEFEKYKGGCCHDFSNYIYYTFSVLKPTYNLIFIILRNGFFAHSYNSFRGKYLMEFTSSNKGMTEFNDKEAMVNDMKDHLINCFRLSQNDVIKIENYVTKPPNTSDSYMEYCDNVKRKVLDKQAKCLVKRVVAQ